VPIDQQTALNITCDNPACPGNDLDPANRLGWFIVTSEIYGQATTQHVFCSKECAAAAALDEASAFGELAPEPTGIFPPTGRATP
jgi:hypothetical protein